MREEKKLRESLDKEREECKTVEIMKPKGALKMPALNIPLSPILKNKNKPSFSKQITQET